MDEGGGRIVRLASPLLLGCFALGIAAPASGQEVAFLRKDCTGVSDCFTTSASLAGWIANTRQPSAADPLIVKMGPGDFDSLRCSSAADHFDHVTVIGSGREHSRFVCTSGCISGIQIDACDALEFIDLAAVGPYYGVLFLNEGDSTWTDTDVVGGLYGWYDACGSQSPEQALSQHYFFGSRVIGNRSGAGSASFTRTTAFAANCGESWFYGGEIAAIPEPNPSNPEAARGVEVKKVGDVRVFGAAIRVVTREMSPSPAFWDEVVGVQVGYPRGGYTSGTFHMHGGIISVDAKNMSAQDVAGLDVNDVGTGFAHTPATAFTVNAGGTGTATRVKGPAQSPFLWPAGATPPVSTSEDNALSSEDGMDMFVETDCNGSGDCDGGGSETHLMIYNETLCGTGSPPDPWFDATRGACR